MMTEINPRKALALKIRRYTREQIERDFSNLVKIGGDAKHHSPQRLTGNKVVDAFTFPARLETVGSKGISFYDLWESREMYAEKAYIKKFLEYENGKRKTPNDEEKIWYTVFRFYFSPINCFRPIVAMEYYARFSPRCVLDMTAGWGGRLVGACALNVPRYVGIDNNTDLKEGYEKLTEFLRPHTSTEIDIRIENALEVDYSAIEYDMVFTSPPYYNLEIYGGRSPPINEGRGKGKRSFLSKDEWDNEFYRPLFEKTYKHLSLGGHYCLNIPVNVYERVCIPLLGIPTYTIPLNKNNRNQSKKYVEYVYVWVKG